MRIKGPDIWKNIFAPALQTWYQQNIPPFGKFEAMLSEKSGKTVIDHAAFRALDKTQYDNFLDIMEAFGLKKQNDYDFPDKKLKSVDMQLPGEDAFKMFCTLGEVNKLSQEAQTAIQEDTARIRNAMRLSDIGNGLLAELRELGSLEQADAELLVSEIINNVMHRPASIPVKRATLELVKAESPEMANALVLGLWVNHLAFSLEKCEVEEWAPVDNIQQLYNAMQARGFVMLQSGIQGKPASEGGLLRQTSCNAALTTIRVLEADHCTVSEIQYPTCFIEPIARAIDPKTGKLFLGFLPGNANAIFASTGTKAPTDKPEYLQNILATGPKNPLPPSQAVSLVQGI